MKQNITTTHWPGKHERTNWLFPSSPGIIYFWMIYISMALKCDRWPVSYLGGVHNCPPPPPLLRDFEGISSKGQIPWRHPSSSCVYIETYLQLKYTVKVPEKISICLIRGRMREKKKENLRGDRLGWFCGTYCTVTLRCSWVTCYQWHSVQQCFESYEPKDTRYKRGWFYSVGITMNIHKNLKSFPNMSLSFTNLWLETIFQTLFSLP